MSLALGQNFYDRRFRCFFTPVAAEKTSHGVWLSKAEWGRCSLYNHVRLHSAIEYVTPADKLAGRAQEILTARGHKLDAARERRKLARQAAAALV